jgi:hypothetical protein
LIEASPTRYLPRLWQLLNQLQAASGVDWPTLTIQPHLFQPTVRTGPVGNSGCSYAVSSWYNPDKYPGTGARVWCSGTRLIKLQHALYWMRPGGPSSLYMASPQWSYGVTRDTGEWGYIDVVCPKGTWQWPPVVYIWINHQYMGSFPGHWGGFTACEG